jgi:hypothetical protein
MHLILQSSLLPMLGRFTEFGQQRGFPRYFLTQFGSTFIRPSVFRLQSEERAHFPAVLKPARVAHPFDEYLPPN